MIFLRQKSFADFFANQIWRWKYYKEPSRNKFFLQRRSLVSTREHEVKPPKIVFALEILTSDIRPIPDQVFWTKGRKVPYILITSIMLGTSGFYGRNLSFVTEIQGWKGTLVIAGWDGWGSKIFLITRTKAWRRIVLKSSCAFCRVGMG